MAEGCGRIHAHSNFVVYYPGESTIARLGLLWKFINRDAARAIAMQFELLSPLPRPTTPAPLSGREGGGEWIALAHVYLSHRRTLNGE